MIRIEEGQVHVDKRVLHESLGDLVVGRGENFRAHFALFVDFMQVNLK